MDSRKRGQSVMDVRNEEETTVLPEHADYAGSKNDRRSTSSFQIFVDGNLVESRVRAQKSIALFEGNQSSSPWSLAALKGCWSDIFATK